MPDGNDPDFHGYQGQLSSSIFEPWPDERSEQCRKRWTILCNPVLTFNGSALAILAVASLASHVLTIQCTLWYVTQHGTIGARPQSFTPLHRLMDIRYETTTLRSGHLANSSAPDAIYRMPQSSEVHKAWSDLTRPAVFPITREDVIRLGKDPAVAIKAPKEYGWPEDTYLGSLEFTHQLHCLDTLRRNLLPNYHYYWGSRFGFTPNIVWEWHITHCLDLLRQHLMCTADTTVFTYILPENQDGMFGDFSVEKKCVNSDKFIEFNNEMREKYKQSMDLKGKSWRDILHVIEAPPLWGVSQITNRTRIIDYEGEEMAIETIAGLEGREYCLGDTDGFVV
ncbi:hypothetical protein CKM354_000627400 [Cercospora kikuchii]|uniref:Uncharacterized protein n=1 Tax=Cercospora kikuchii TaxID=84275 RepID=A0A9P3CNQ9_9PEZI|nr:uncharacterized protein CKM354_000627400 [Cercospora kikuchii]GIZ43030.1 hypothetical protein CKM354_000627400 [Cercospora kikuchii]